MPIQYILFDLDDTLYSYSSGLFKEVGARIEAWVCQKLALTPEEAKALRREYFEAYGTTMMGLRHHHPELDIDDYLDYVHEVDVSAYLTPRSDLDTMLTAILATKGIFTNGIASWADRILQKMAIRRHFGPIIDVRATDYRGKPWPEAYRRALDLLGCEGASCALVDDQPRNLEQAAAFGMRTVLVRPGGQVGPGVDFAVDAIEETGAVLRKLVNGNQKSVMGNE